MAAQERSSAFMFDYIDLISGVLVAEYCTERERMMRSAEQLRAETVRTILAGGRSRRRRRPSSARRALRRVPLLPCASGRASSEASLAAEHPERAAAVVLIDGGLPMPYPPDLDVDAVLQAILGPAIQRLHRTFASVEEYVAFWRAQPARRTSTIQRSSLAAVAREAAMPARPPRRSWGRASDSGARTAGCRGVATAWCQSRGRLDDARGLTRPKPRARHHRTARRPRQTRQSS